MLPNKKCGEEDYYDSEEEVPTHERVKFKNDSAIRDFKSTDSSEFMFPQEIDNRQQELINNLRAENGALRRCLNEREQELEREKEKSSTSLYHGGMLAGVGRASDLAASKIVELSKRVRELTAELESERSRRQKMAVKMAQLENLAEEEKEGGLRRGVRITDKTDSLRQNSNYPDRSEEGKRDDEIKILKEKLYAANAKITEWRNQCLGLKQDLKLADKILASEIGDAATLEVAKATLTAQNLSGGASSGWRGRAQQITLLRHKLSELQERLRKVESEHKDGEGGTSYMEELRKEREKRVAEVESMQTSLVEAEKRAEEWKRKAEVSRARAAALRAEAEAVRVRMSTVLAKAEHDDQLILSLNECLNNKDALLQEKDSEIKAIVEKNTKEKDEMQEELLIEKTKVSHMKDALRDKEQTLEKLENKLKELTSSSESRENKSLLQSKSAWWNLSPSELELQAAAQAAEAERIRLIELVSVLNKRLDVEQNQTDQASKALRLERQKNVRLEVKAARMELELSSGRNKMKYYSRNNSSCSTKEVVPEEIKYRLEILEEEKLALESRIECLKQEKEEDFKKYISMLRETREVFLSKLELIENSHKSMNNHKNNSSSSNR